MARKLEERLAKVAAVQDDPRGPEAQKTLRAALRSNVGVLVASAVKVAIDADPTDLVDELSPAFARLLERPIKRDPGCRGKTAIARALHDLDRFEDEVFEPGVRHVQKEPVWGGSEDTAAELRGVCGYAYAHSGHPDALRVLAELLADKERAARAAAARALGDAGRADADALLRYKLLCGDPDPEVITACVSSLVSLDVSAALPFVDRFIDTASPDDAVAAVLALGESRADAAEPILVRWCETAMDDEEQRVGYLALALLRAEAATAYLLGIIESGPPGRALHAVSALATFRADPTLAARVREAAKPADPSVRAEVDSLFEA